MKNVKIAEKAGFCFGVSRAVNIAKDGAKEKKIATLGPIIHNQSVVDELAGMGVRIINNPADAEPGETVVIRSHGVKKRSSG